MVTGIFFQAIGKPTQATILSLSRQIIFLLPATILLPITLGVEGVLWAGPVADGLAFVIAATLLVLEVKHFGKEKIKSEALIDDTSTDNQLNKQIVITISREYGSGGRYVGRLIADKLGIKLYDKDFITEVASKTGLSEEYIESQYIKNKVAITLSNKLQNEIISKANKVLNLYNHGMKNIIFPDIDNILKQLLK